MSVDVGGGFDVSLLEFEDDDGLRNSENMEAVGVTDFGLSF